MPLSGGCTVESFAAAKAATAIAAAMEQPSAAEITSATATAASPLTAPQIDHHHQQQCRESLRMGQRLEIRVVRNKSFSHYCFKYISLSKMHSSLFYSYEVISNKTRDICFSLSM